MPKFDRHSISDPRLRRQRSPTRWIMVGLIALIAFPLLIDVVRVYMAQWAALYGPVPIVETYALDDLTWMAREVVHELEAMVRYPFRQIPWRTNWGIGILIVTATVGIWMLNLRTKFH